MNSRERILTALRGGVADRVPISTYELCGFNSLAWENRDDSYAPLMAFIREHTDCLCMWEPAADAVFLESAYPADMDVSRERIDEAAGAADVITRVLHTPKGDLRHVSKVYDDVHTTWTLEHWCKSTDDVDKALSVPYEPLRYDANDLARLNSEIDGHGIVMDSLSDPLWMAADLMEFGQYTLWALTETEHFIRTLDVMHERCMENLRRRLDHPVELYRICGPEYACPPYLPPSFFDELVTPYVRDMIDLIHSRGALARFHCHGKIGQVLDGIMATGTDAIDPCEPPPDGDVPLDELKRTIGKQMCLCGSLELKLLEQGSQQEVAGEVRACMAAAKQDGGYIILPTASPINSPLARKTIQNYITFIETALAEGKY